MIKKMINQFLDLAETDDQLIALIIESNGDLKIQKRAIKLLALGEKTSSDLHLLKEGQTRIIASLIQEELDCRKINTVYRTSKQIGEATLKLGDEVIFQGGIDYFVTKDSLQTKTVRDSLIFEYLRISRYEICKKHYGYEPGEDDWPKMKEGDFKALTRVVKALFEIMESKGQ